MYKLVFYVPIDHLEPVKQAVFATGAGKIGEYESCCWQVLGVGQFRPLAGSAPYLGRVGSLAEVEEYRVELVCDDATIKQAIRALTIAHPYEEPAYDVWRLADFDL
ncbi:NGG1p interacting factor NIF3 [Porticoccus sp.]|uniref:NGG1p interacting factor NIF3 n=1 Tax=Porticoccus sp. TaxID=2024853 RepID=UPI003F6A0336